MLRDNPGHSASRGNIYSSYIRHTGQLLTLASAPGEQELPCLPGFGTKGTARGRGSSGVQPQPYPQTKRLANNSCVYTRENRSHGRAGETRDVTF